MLTLALVLLMNPELLMLTVALGGIVMAAKA
jgi:hypothetical protein